MQLLRTTKPPRGKLGRFKFHGVPADPNRLRLGARGSRFRWRDNGTNLHDQTNPTNQLAKAKLVERRSRDGQARTGRCRCCCSTPFAVAALNLRSLELARINQLVLGVCFRNQLVNPRRLPRWQSDQDPASGLAGGGGGGRDIPSRSRVRSTAAYRATCRA